MEAKLKKQSHPPLPRSHVSKLLQCESFCDTFGTWTQGLARCSALNNNSFFKQFEQSQIITNSYDPNLLYPNTPHAKTFFCTCVPLSRWHLSRYLKCNMIRWAADYTNGWLDEWMTAWTQKRKGRIRTSGTNYWNCMFYYVFYWRD